MTLTDLHYLSATDVLRAYRSRELSPVEVLDAVIARADAVEPTVNALLERDHEDYRAAAVAAAERYAGTGAAPRVLEGLPVALKEEQPIAGRSLRFGSLLTEGWVSEETHPVAERVLGAGALVHARTTTPEFSCAAFTHSALWGITRNPWNPDFGPGGSSGGSGAALASGTAYLASGSDIGGSIRIPASLNGVVGFKPPYGRVPAMAPFNLDTYCHDGPMGRTVADVALFQNVIQGQHPFDHVSLPAVPIPEDLGDVRRDAHRARAHARRLPGRPRGRGEHPGLRRRPARCRRARRRGHGGAHARRGHVGGARALRLDHGSVDAGVQRARRPEVHGVHAALPRRCRPPSTRRSGCHAGLTLEAKVHRSLATVFLDHDALICPTLGTTGFVAGDDYTEHGITVAGEYVQPYIFAGAHPGVQHREPPPRAQRPVRSRDQRRADRGPGRGPSLRRRHGVPRRRGGRARARAVGPTRPGAPLYDDRVPLCDTAVNAAVLSLGSLRSTSGSPRRPDPHLLAVALWKDISPMQDMPARRRKILGFVGVGAAVAVTAACSGAPAPTSSGATSAPTSNYTVLMPPPTADAGDVVWATYRETQTLDPIQAFDYPENTIDPLLCDSLLRQKPDMTIGDGIATYTNPSPTEFDFTLNANAKFWDGPPVSPADVVYSLNRDRPQRWRVLRPTFSG